MYVYREGYIKGGSYKGVYKGESIYYMFIERGI